MIVTVTKIQKIASNLVLFWNGSNLIRPITVIKEMDLTNGKVRLLCDDGWFEFYVYAITEISDGVSTRTYTALSTTRTTPDDYNTRAQLIYQYLVGNILKGCCCDDSNPNTQDCCWTEYEYDSPVGDGDWYYDSGTGKLSVSFLSNIGQDFTNLLHHYVSGAWVYFISKADKTQFTVFEITGYAAVGTVATWDATVIDGLTTYDANAQFCVWFDNSGGGTGGSDLQGTIDAGATMDKDNTVDGDGNSFTWDKFLNYYINVAGEFEVVSTNGSQDGIIHADSSEVATTIINSTGTKYAGTRAYDMGGGTYKGVLQAFGAGVRTFFEVLSNALFIGTPNVAAGSATVGLPLILQNASTGEAEYAKVATNGIADQAVTYAKIQNVSATDKILGRSTAGAGTIEEIDCTAAGRAILDDANAAAQRTTLGIKNITPIFMSPLSDTVAASTTTFYSFYFGIGTDSTTEVNRAVVIGIGGVYQRLYVYINGAQSAGGSLVINPRAATGMGAFSDGATSVTIAAGSAAGIYSDLVNTTTYAAGDRATMKVQNNAAAPSAPISSFWGSLESTY